MEDANENLGTGEDTELGKSSSVKETTKEQPKGEHIYEQHILTARDADIVDDYANHHDSPAEIRKHQLENLNPAHTAIIPVLTHDIPEHRKVAPESYLWLSLFTLIFFSRIFGVVALYFSIRVRLSFLEKKYEESEKWSRQAKIWNFVGMIFCVIWVILVVVLLKGSGVFEGDDNSV